MMRTWLILLVAMPQLLFGAAIDSVLYMVGNAHIDLAYRWRWNETIDRVGPDTFIGVLNLLDSVPDWTYAQSQLALYESIEKTHPEVFKRICYYIDQKRWSVVGGQWAEPDAILPSGESFIRQFLIGMEYCRSHLGVQNVDIAWVPDSFCGQALTLPQIYSGCGIRYYLFGRGAPTGKQIFWWIGPDSSRLLAYHLPLPYGLTNPNANHLPALHQWFQLAGIPFAMVIFGEGDHGGGPRQADMDAIEKLNHTPGFPHLQYSNVEEFFRRLMQRRTLWPSHVGEIGRQPARELAVSGSWLGSYTSQARLKKRHRDAENLLLTAEKFASIGSMLQCKPLFPRVDFREAWKLLLRNQFHDILPGTSIADVYDDSQKDFDHIDAEGRRLLRFGLEIIGSRIDTRGSAMTLVVYNPCSWTRSDGVSANLCFIEPCDRFAIQDDAGRPVLYQILNRSADKRHYSLLLAVRDIPSVGYKVFHVFPNTTPALVTDLRTSTHSIENQFFKVSWDQVGITSLFDKRQQREMLSGTADCLQLHGERRFSSWHMVLSGEQASLRCLQGPQLIEKGPVRTVVRWQDRSESSLFTRELALLAGQERIDFSMTVDWHEHDRLLKVAFPLNVPNGRATFEQPYGSIERAGDGVEHPAQNWIDLSNEEYGVALLNDGKYGFDVKDQTMRMSVVRGSRDMDPRMDEGEHSFGYALFPHSGNWKEAAVMQAGLEINQPLISLQENHHIGTLPTWADLDDVTVPRWTSNNEFSLPQQFSFFSVDKDHVIISAIKVQQGDWSPANIVLRLFETIGKSGRIKVTCPVKPRTVQVVNHIEDSLANAPAISLDASGFVLDMKAHEIRTVLIEF